MQIYKYKYVYGVIVKELLLLNVKLKWPIGGSNFYWVSELFN